LIEFIIKISKEKPVSNDYAHAFYEIVSEE
jgi:hypothetical protein